MFATIPVFLSVLILIVPIFVCSSPEVFEHNVNLEFLADNLYEIKLRLNKYMKDKFKEQLKAQAGMLFTNTTEAVVPVS